MKIKNIKKIIILTALLSLFICGQLVLAQGQAPVDALRQVGDPTKLPSFDVLGHSEAPVEPGAAEIGSVGLFALDAIRYVVGTIAFFFVIIAAIKLITAGKDIEDVITKQKENFKYIAIPLLIVMLVDPLVRKVFFGYEGEVFTTETYAKEYANEGVAQIMGVVNFIEMFIGVVAVLLIIGSGLAIMVGGGVEETRTKHIKHILYAIGGLMLVGLSELLVKGILFPKRGEELPDLTAGRLTIQNITNFATSFIAVISIAMAVYAGYLYVLGATNEENTQKAKKVLFGAIIGVILAAGAFAIVNTLIPDPPPNIQPETIEKMHDLSPEPLPGKLY